MMKNGDFGPFEHLEDTRIEVPPLQSEGEEALAEKRSGHRFIKVPTAWLGPLRKARRCSTYALALALLQIQFEKFGRGPIKLSNKALEPFGITRQDKHRSLPELEAMGLIKVKRDGKKSPLVTLIGCR